MRAILFTWLTGTAGLAVIIYQNTHSPLPELLIFPTLALTLGAPLLYAILTYRYVRKFGYTKLQSAVLPLTLLAFILSGEFFHWPLLILAALSFPLLAPPAKRYLAPSLAILITLSMILLAENGFRIYGESRFYYPKPKPHEGWIAIDHLEPPNLIVLEDDTKISIHPFRFIEEPPDLPQFLKGMLIARTPIRKTFLRYDPSIKHDPWEIRYHNYFVCVLPSFFPNDYDGILYGRLLDELTPFMMNGFITEVADDSAFKAYLNKSKEYR
ncbi:hypothetical protein VDG1235_3158 [Verrucomicrobiia bacterium DG1235]|nr:hypothetical protein VDG1235_3158 [Verrucomicrobiae bacterium DG1235]